MVAAAGLPASVPATASRLPASVPATTFPGKLQSPGAGCLCAMRMRTWRRSGSCGKGIAVGSHQACNLFGGQGAAPWPPGGLPPATGAQTAVHRKIPFCPMSLFLRRHLRHAVHSTHSMSRMTRALIKDKTTAPLPPPSPCAGLRASAWAIGACEEVWLARRRVGRPVGSLGL